MRRRKVSGGLVAGNGARSKGAAGSRQAASPRSLAALLPEGRFIGGRDIFATEVCDTVEACGPGRIFVARMRPDGDGHDDVAAAVAAGIAGICVERMVPAAGVPQCLVADSTWRMPAFARRLPASRAVP